MARAAGLLIVVSMAWGSAAAPAAQVRVMRYGDDRLALVTAVDVVLDPLRADSARCGIARDALQQAVVGALQAEGMSASVSEKASSWHHTVFVTASTVFSDGHCATGLVTELMAQVEGIPVSDRGAPPGQWGSLLVGQLTLIRHNGIVSSKASAHAADVRAMVREHARAIAARVGAAAPSRNPPPPG